MARQPPDPHHISEIFIDETSQTKHRFLILGGLILHSSHVAQFDLSVERMRLPELPQGEMGWVKVSRTKLPAYRRLVDFFFDNPGQLAPFEFHSLVVDTHRLNDKAFNEGSREIGFNKEIYQLCQKFARLHGQRLFHVYPDARSTKSSTEELRLILNRGLAKKGDGRAWAFRRLHFRNSAECHALQLVDVLLGALAYRLNGHHLAENASPAKSELATHVLERARISDVTRDTSVRGKFTIWHRDLK